MAKSGSLNFLCQDCETKQAENQNGSGLDRYHLF